MYLHWTSPTLEWNLDYRKNCWCLNSNDLRGQGREFPSNMNNASPLFLTSVNRVPPLPITGVYLQSCWQSVFIFLSKNCCSLQLNKDEVFLCVCSGDWVFGEMHRCSLLMKNITENTDGPRSCPVHKKPPRGVFSLTDMHFCPPDNHYTAVCWAPLMMEFKGAETHDSAQFYINT